MEIVKEPKGNIQIWIDGDLIAYLWYIDKTDQYWAPRIFIKKVKVETEYRRIGLASLLLKEIIKMYPNDILILEIVEGGETHVDYLRELYQKNGFREIEETGHSYIYAYEPEGMSVDKFKPMPKHILKKEIDDTDTGYSLELAYIDDLQDVYNSEGYENFNLFYDDIKDSLVMRLLNYY